MTFLLRCVLITCFLLTICTSCVSDDDPDLDPGFVAGPADRLTKQELNSLIRSGQEFAVHSASVRKRLTPEQCHYIRKTLPAVKDVYYAPKYGLLEMRWKISKQSELILRSRGYLNRKKQNWELEICITKESAPVPDGFLHPDLEKSIALPPK